MKKSKITGWKDVYRFTIAQNVKNKSYMISTIVITLFVAILCVCINLLPAIIFDQSENETIEEMNVDTIYINDRSGLAKLNYGDLLQREEFQNVSKVVETESNEFEENDTETKNNDVCVEIVADDSGYQVLVSVPESSGVSDQDAHSIGYAVKEYFKEGNCRELNLTEEQVEMKEMPVLTSVIMLGEQEETNFIALFVEYFANAVLVIVFMLLIHVYGKMTASIVAMEKSSKVLELLLTSVRPVATIVGKVFAMATLLFGQIVLWIIVGTASYFGSHVILAGIDSKYAIGLNDVMDTLKQAGIIINLSPIVILLSIAIILTGFTVYIAISGFVGATVGKIEELGQAIQIFSFLAVAGAYIPLFGFINMISTGMKDTPLLNISRILPISSLYIIPSEMILGSNTLSSGLLALGINIATLLILMLLISKVYESVILHSGNRLKLKDVIRMSKN